MKQNWIWLLIPLLVGCSLFQRTPTPSSAVVKDVPYEARSGDNLRHRVVVLPFLDVNLQRSQNAGEEARRTMVRELVRTGQFVVINPNDVPQDPKKFLTPEGEYDLEQLSKALSGMGISAVIEGKILDLRAKRIGDPVGLIRKVKARMEADVRLRMVAARTGREIYNEVRSAAVEAETTRVAERSFSDRYLSEDPDLIRQSIRQAVNGGVPAIARAVEKLSWEGRVAMISGERVFVNAGRLSGIQVGDILKVTEEGEEVFDPETGRFIGKAPGRMKGTIEVISYFGKDGAIAVLHSGSGFKENDRVELY